MKPKTLIILLYSCAISPQNWAQSTLEATRNNDIPTNQEPTEQKKDLTPEDYKLWEGLRTHSISDDGDWYTYYLNKTRISRYKYKESTLYLGSTKSAIIYDFPFGGRSQFSKGSQWFTCLVPEKGLVLLDLKKGTKQWFNEVVKFEFSPDGNYLLAHKKGAGHSKVSDLIILNLKSKTLDIIADVETYVVRPNSNDLGYIQNTADQKTVKLFTLGEAISTTIIQNNQYPYKNLVWNATGTALAFFGEQSIATEAKKKVSIYCYKTINHKSKVYSLDATTNDSFFNKYISDSELKFDLKGMALYFKVKESEDQETTIANGDPDDVEVWRTSDKVLYPGKNSNSTKLAMWHPERDKTTLLETDVLPKAIISNDGKYMLSYDPLLYAPSFATTINKDLYLTDLETGDCHLFLKRYGGSIQISPNSKYITYFLDKDWWIYDLERNKHTNITKTLPAAWHDTSHEFPHQNGLKPYSDGYITPGWTKGDKELIVYDAYDVWLIAPTGKARRITRGRESQIRHRIYNRVHLYKNDVKFKEYINWFSGGINLGFDLSEGLLFKTVGADKASGYAIWYPGKEAKVLVYKNMRINNLRKSSHTDVYTYMEQSVNISPRIRYLGKERSGSRLLKASNLQQKQFHWGHSELVDYKDPDGKALQGALLYPANYTLGKKYPMIVEIYEKLSMALHRYVNPTEFNGSRLNPSNYTTAGYFMFYPDINHTLNEVGMSTVHCVEAGVKAVIARGLVDVDRIGLTGHSFGGYETNFIITQSNFFAAAVAGAGISDLVADYHRLFGAKSTMLRFEDWQYCFKDSFYKNPEVYLDNSPLHHATNINTPLLLWSGKEDTSVNYKNSLALYLGLRRLNKTCELLLYPGEGHSLSKTKNQIDRTRRIKAWFDTYLKAPL